MTNNQKSVFEDFGIREKLIQKINIIREVKQQYNWIDSISEIEENLWNNLKVTEDRIKEKIVDDDYTNDRLPQFLRSLLKC